MAKRARVWTGTQFVELASAQTDLTAYSTTAQISSTYSPVSTTGLVLLNTTDFTAQSTVSINNCFSSNYTNYRILISATSSIAGGANGNIRLRVGGVDNSAAIYNRQFLRAIGTTVSASYDTLTETQLVDINSSYAGVAFADVFNPALPVKTRILANFSASRIDYIALFYTNHNTDTAYDGFSFIPSAGTATGTIKVYGYKN